MYQHLIRLSPWTRRRLAVPIAVGTLLLALISSAAPALAWSQVFNDFDTGGSGYCGGSTTYPCVYWQEANYTSITLYNYFSPSVDSDNYSFTNSINRAFSDFNAAPAYNPYLYQCTNRPGCGTNVYYGANLSCGVYGQTTWPVLSSIEYSSTFGYYQFARQVNVYFNTNSIVSWNDTLTWSFDPGTCAVQADGRKVATHETGHLTSLGHTGYTAVMHQGPENFYSLQSNDIQGLQAIYTGTQPSS